MSPQLGNQWLGNGTQAPLPLISDSGRQPLHYFRFLGYLAGHFYFPINYDGRGHEDTVLRELLHVLNIQHFRVQTLLLHYVLNQVVQLVAFGSACT